MSIAENRQKKSSASWLATSRSPKYPTPYILGREIARREFEMKAEKIRAAKSE